MDITSIDDIEDDDAMVLQHYLSGGYNKRRKVSHKRHKSTKGEDIEFNNFTNHVDAAITEDAINTNAVNKRISDVVSDVRKNVTIQNITEDVDVVIHHPKLTRPILSIYEYVAVHTELGKFIDAQTSLAQFVDDVEINDLVNPAELAFELLRNHKWDVVINRGYERVSYSQLKYNKQWEDMLERYFKAQHQTQNKEIHVPLGLLASNKSKSNDDTSDSKPLKLTVNDDETD